jgi:L-iditol 2-dehydrogenase
VKAIQFDLKIPRYALGLALKRAYPPVLWSQLSCLSLRELPEPILPNPHWVKIKTRLGGICGTDMQLIQLNSSPTLSALGSFPFTLGHENTGTIAEVGREVGGFSIGDRVVAEPTLWCKPRGFSDLCGPCSRGEIQLCERLKEGDIAPGVEIGYCRDTGGSWGEYYLAHESQLVRVPDRVSDENALLLEPFAVGLHAVLSNRPRDDETVLVIGAGVIGLGILAALRGTGSKARIVVLAKHGIQKEMARRYGADQVIAVSRGSDYLAQFAEALGAKVLNPIIGKRFLFGGAETVFECVGKSDTLDDALRMAGPRGRVVLVGLPSFPRGVDWTSIWMKELDIRGSLTYGYDIFQGHRKRTFELALDLMTCGRVDLSPLLTHRFPLQDYARAFQLLSGGGRGRVVKATFEF